MNINILDPGLHSAGGHHLEWDLRLVRELAARNHRVTVYAHREIDAAVAARLASYAEVIPHFRVTPYLMPARFTQPPASGMHVFDPIAGQMAHFLEGAKYLADDLRSVAAADSNIWPSLTASQLYALALAPTGALNACCMQTEPSFAASAGHVFWRYAWLQGRGVGLKLRLGVTVPELHTEYASLLPEERIHVWPICVDGHPPAMPRGQVRRIGFFGQQRGEKGVSLLQHLVPPLLAEGWEVVVHDSGELIRGDGAGRLIRLGYVEDIVAEISRCDLIVLPYDLGAYRSRGSGIVWEALACGVPTVVPRASAPGRLVTTLGAGIGMESVSVDDVRNAISAAVSNYGSISGNAFLASQRWSESHGIRRFADALSNCA